MPITTEFEDFSHTVHYFSKKGYKVFILLQLDPKGVPVCSVFASFPDGLAMEVATVTDALKLIGEL